MKHKEYYLNFIIDLGLKYYKQIGDTVGVSIILSEQIYLKEATH